MREGIGGDRRFPVHDGAAGQARTRLRRWSAPWVAGAVLLGLVPCSGGAAAAEPLNTPVPLEPAVTRVSAGQLTAGIAAARRAHDLGLPTVAVGILQELMGAPGVDPAAIVLPLASALVDVGRAAEADRLLNAHPGSRGPEWRLRIAMVAAQQKRWDEVRNQIREINVDQLTRPDRAWFWFLQGAVADTSVPRDISKANDNYHLAEREATSEFARATFLSASARLRLTAIPYGAADVQLLRERYEAEQARGRAAYLMAEDYAVMRDATGGKNEAVRFLSDVLLRLPRNERQWTDRLRLLLGLIGDRMRGGAGRNALNLLLEQGSTPDLQRQALQLLAQDSQREPERGLFRAEMDKLLGAAGKPQILDAILLMRAQFALGEKDYATVERRANELKDNFPGSSLRPQALMMLAGSAWEQRRYRVAAENARLAREALAGSPSATDPFDAKAVAQHVAQLRVFEAEARFRAQDYRLAAEAYAAALREAPEGISAGDLMFQQALAAIRADANDPKADLTKIVDELESDPRFDPTNRWEAEWSLARGLRIQGKTDAALGRVTRLLEADRGAGVSPELRARMAWLQVRLSSDANRPELTLQLVPRLSNLPAGVPPELRTEIVSAASLLKAEAEFKLDRQKEAEETLAKLRAEYPQSDAAIYSYLVTASYFAGRDQIQSAQLALQALIEAPQYQASQYVPYALFQLALLSERRGQPRDLRDANETIETLVNPARNPPASPDLVFAARLKQGDILRTLNDFPNAQLAYESLVNDPKHAQRPDLVVAQLRLAECHNAQSSTDPTGSHADIAQSIFEELLYRVSAPADVRVEAGYNLGKMLERRGQLEKARTVWFAEVVKPFFLDLKPGEPLRATQPYWLARTMLDLGALLEQRENLDEARRVYVILRDSKLGFGETTAAERLQRLGIPAMATAAATPKP